MLILPLLSLLCIPICHGAVEIGERDIDDWLEDLDEALSNVSRRSWTPEELRLEEELGRVHETKFWLPKSIALPMPSNSRMIFMRGDVRNSLRVGEEVIQYKLKKGERLDEVLRRIFSQYPSSLPRFFDVAEELLILMTSAWKTTLPGHVSVADALKWEAVDGGELERVSGVKGKQREWGGLATSVPKELWSQYWLAQRRLEDEIEERGSTMWEGCSAQNPRSILSFLSLALSSPDIKHVCEVGFNAGHSALAFLMARSDIKVLSFDLGQYQYSFHGLNILHKWFPGRVEVVWGNSIKTIPDTVGVGGWGWERGWRCDAVLVDGGHSFHTVLADVKHLIDATHIQHQRDVDEAVKHNSSPPPYTPVPFLLDDGYFAPFSQVDRAFFRLVEANLLTHNSFHIPITRFMPSPLTPRPAIVSHSSSNPQLPNQASLVLDTLHTSSPSSPPSLVTLHDAFIPTPSSINPITQTPISSPFSTFTTTNAALLVALTKPISNPPTVNPAVLSLHYLLPHLSHLNQSSLPSLQPTPQPPPPQPPYAPYHRIDAVLEPHKHLAKQLRIKAVQEAADTETILAYARAEAARV